MKAFLISVLFAGLVMTSCGGNEVNATATSGGDSTANSSPTDTSQPTAEDTSTTSTIRPDGTASSVDDTVDDVVLIWTETGGCAQGGPNCARYEITADGAVTTYRGDEVTAANEGTIDADEVASWWSAASQVDVDALVARLGPGELTAAYDGIDVAVELPVTGVELSSVDVNFDESEPFIDSTQKLVRQAAAVAPLEQTGR